jgi:hypothetical protein
MNIPTIESLITCHPSDTFMWIRDNPSFREFNWLLLAQVCGHMSYDQKILPEDQLLWAKASIVVYDILADCPDPHKNSFEVSAMYVRLKAIINHGEVSGDAIRDVKTITDWFQKRLTLSFEEYQRRAAGWPATPELEKLRMLRGLKNRINVIQFAAKAGLIKDKSILRWIGIRKMLP